MFFSFSFNKTIWVHFTDTFGHITTTTFIFCSNLKFFQFERISFLLISWSVAPRDDRLKNKILDGEFQPESLFFGQVWNMKNPLTTNLSVKMKWASSWCSTAWLCDGCRCDWGGNLQWSKVSLNLLACCTLALGDFSSRGDECLNIDRVWMQTLFSVVSHAELCCLIWTRSQIWVQVSESIIKKEKVGFVLL